MGGDGMIGLDALINQRLMMDFEDRVITVDDQLNQSSMTGDVIVVTGRLRQSLILTDGCWANQGEAVVGGRSPLGTLRSATSCSRRRTQAWW